MSFEKGKEQLQKGKAKLTKGKQGLFRLIFSRTAIFALLVLVQIGFWIEILNRLTAMYALPIYVATNILSVVLVIYIINKAGMNPAFKLVWMIPLIGMPVFGAVLYLFLNMQIQPFIIKRRLRKQIDCSRKLLQQDLQTEETLRSADEYTASLSYYLNHSGGFPVYSHTKSRYFPTGEEAFAEMKRQLRQARHFIFLEYFILREGRMLSEILDILEEKVKEGVEVRFIYDGMCSLTILPYGYIKKIRERGIKCQIFAPVIPALSTYQNNRDHRKILVIDNQVAFTGGINLADEYINELERFGYWKDNSIMIEGDAVSSFTVMFLQIWYILDKSEQEYERFLRPSEKCFAEPSGFVQPYCDSPLDSEIFGESVYLSVLAQAKRYVHIMTPYLILDNETLFALKFAAKRGVEVTILMPHIPDKKYAFWLAKTYYRELLEAGVKIFEFTPGFVHSKVFVSDDETAVVGTINLDYRSLYLHYECAVYLYQTETVAQVEADFRESVARSVAVTEEDCDRLPLPVRFFGQVLRLIAPLM